MPVKALISQLPGAALDIPRLVEAALSVLVRLTVLVWLAVPVVRCLDGSLVCCLASGWTLRLLCLARRRWTYQSGAAFIASIETALNRLPCPPRTSTTLVVVVLIASHIVADSRVACDGASPT